MYEWDEIDAQAEREGKATKGAHRMSRPSRGVSRDNLSDVCRDYRAKKKKNLLVELNVIDGKPTL